MNMQEMEGDEHVPATKVSDRLHDAAKKQHEKQLKDALRRLGAKKASPKKYGNAFENPRSGNDLDESLQIMDQLFLQKVTQILEAGVAPKQDNSSNMISPDVKTTGKTPVVVGDKNGSGMSTKDYAKAQGVTESQETKEERMKRVLNGISDSLKKQSNGVELPPKEGRIIPRRKLTSTETGNR